MNRSFDDLPCACDVLVIGAGPAGSAAALTLARGGADVVLVDQHVFPRDKTCGDGLIPDAHAALARLGVLDAVMAQACVAHHVTLIGPRGGRLEVPATLAVLPRRELDDLLCRAAVAAGARMHAPASFDAPLLDAASGAVVGARLRQGSRQHNIIARTVVLATGAAPQALLSAGLCQRRQPSGMAMRLIVSMPPAAAGTSTLNSAGLEVVWHPRLRDGYGWVFPAPNGCFNVGVGWFHRRNAASSRTAAAAGDGGLHQRFQTLREVHPGVRALLDTGTRVGGFKGAPLRCTLEGAAFARPGMLVAGEAAGTTYSLTGEGIGKALESGMLAAESILHAQRGGSAAPPAHLHYTQCMEALRPRFRLYEQANSVNAHPWLADLVIWRARRSPRLRERMSSVLNERSMPGPLLSFKGVRRLLIG